MEQRGIAIQMPEHISTGKDIVRPSVHGHGNFYNHYLAGFLILSTGDSCIHLTNTVKVHKKQVKVLFPSFTKKLDVRGRVGMSSCDVARTPKHLNTTGSYNSSYTKHFVWIWMSIVYFRYQFYDFSETKYYANTEQCGTRIIYLQNFITSKFVSRISAVLYQQDILINNLQLREHILCLS